MGTLVTIGLKNAFYFRLALGMCSALTLMGCESSQFSIENTLNPPVLSPPANGEQDPVVEPPYKNLFKKVYSGGAATYTSGRFTCGITYENQIICWGINDLGQLGNPSSNEDSLSPVLGGDQGEEFLSDVVKMAVGRGHACALISDGSVYCWGTGKAVGNGVNTNATTPKRVIAGDQSNTEIYLKDIVDIGVGFDYSCALSSLGQAYCWGAKDFLGANISAADVYSPKKVLVYDSDTSTHIPLENITSLAVGYRGVCALNTSNVPYCWGDKRNIGLNVKSGASRVAERPLGGEQGGTYLVNVKKIASGWNSACALTFDNELFCWSGKTTDSVPLARRVSISQPIVDIAGGTTFAAITENKTYIINSDPAEFVVSEISSPFEGQPGSSFKSISGPLESFWVIDEKGRSLFVGTSYFKTFRNPDGTYLEGPSWTSLLLMEYLQ